MKKRLIIGLVGNPGSGKSALASYLAETHGFYHFEGSAGIRELADERGITLSSRKEYSDFHRQMQREYGAEVLAERLLARPEERLVFAGLRSVHNARLLQRVGGTIIAMEAPAVVRFERVDKTGLKYENNLADFEASEQAELVSPDGYGSDLGRVMQLADYHLDTASPITQTYCEADEIIERLKAT
jgi:dephospho-CoA kinase